MNKNIYAILIKEHEELVKTNPVCIPLADYISAEAKTLEELRTALGSRLHRLESLKKAYDEAVIQIKNQIVGLQKECKHRITKYHPDGAGGSDSWTECSHCGAEV